MWFMTQERFATKEFFIYGQKRWMYRAPKTASPLNHSKRFMFQFQVIIVPRSLLKKAGTSHIWWETLWISCRFSLTQLEIEISVWLFSPYKPIFIPWYISIASPWKKTRCERALMWLSSQLFLRHELDGERAIRRSLQRKRWTGFEQVKRKINQWLGKYDIYIYIFISYTVSTCYQDIIL